MLYIHRRGKKQNCLSVVPALHMLSHGYANTHTHTHAVLVDNKSKSNHQSHYHSIRNQLHTINIEGAGGQSTFKAEMCFTCRATVQHVEKKSIKTELHQDTGIHITQL